MSLVEVGTVSCSLLDIFLSETGTTRFCSTLEEDPNALLRNLKAEDVRTFFDLIEENHGKGIKADSSLSNYWRVFVRLYVRETGRGRFWGRWGRAFKMPWMTKHSKSATMDPVAGMTPILSHSGLKIPREALSLTSTARLRSSIAPVHSNSVASQLPKLLNLPARSGWSRRCGRNSLSNLSVASHSTAYGVYVLGRGHITV